MEAIFSCNGFLENCKKNLYECVQELNVRDWLSLRELCENILQYVPENAAQLCSDKGHFHFGGFVRKQNFHYCSETKVCRLPERLLQITALQMSDVFQTFASIMSLYFFEEGSLTYCNL